MAERAIRLGVVSDIYIETLEQDPIGSSLGRLYRLSADSSLRYIGSKGMVTFATTAMLSAYQSRLDYIAEDVAKKKTSFAIENITNDFYPSVAAVVGYVEEYAEPLFEMKDNMDNIVTPFLLSVLEHIEDTGVHVSIYDKGTWNNHILDNNRHIVSGEKEMWNAHIEDTDVHVASTDKTTWNTHVEDTDIHVTILDKSTWDAKFNIADTISGIDTKATTLVPALNEVNAIAKGAGNGETVTDIAALVTLLNAAVPTDYPYGKNFYVVDTEVPDFWISAIDSSSVPYVYVDDSTFLDDLAITGSLQIGYYSISELETQKVDLTDYYDKSAADLLLEAKQDTLTFSTDIETDKASTTKVSVIKTLYDWTVGKFIEGPSSATDNAIVRYDGTTGKKAQDSLVSVDDAGNMIANTFIPINSYSVTRDIDGNIVTVTYANSRVVSITRVAGLITKYEDAVYEYVVNRTGVVFDGITVNKK